MNPQLPYLTPEQHLYTLYQQQAAWAQYYAQGYAAPFQAQQQQYPQGWAAPIGYAMPPFAGTAPPATMAGAGGWGMNYQPATLVPSSSTTTGSSTVVKPDPEETTAAAEAERQRKRKVEELMNAGEGEEEEELGRKMEAFLRSRGVKVKTELEIQPFHQSSSSTNPSVSVFTNTTDPNSTHSTPSDHNLASRIEPRTEHPALGRAFSVADPPTGREGKRVRLDVGKDVFFSVGGGGGTSGGVGGGEGAARGEEGNGGWVDKPRGKKGEYAELEKYGVMKRLGAKGGEILRGIFRPDELKSFLAKDTPPIIRTRLNSRLHVRLSGTPQSPGCTFCAAPGNRQDICLSLGAGRCLDCELFAGSAAKCSLGITAERTEGRVKGLVELRRYLGQDAEGEGEEDVGEDDVREDDRCGVGDSGKGIQAFPETPTSKAGLSQLLNPKGERGEYDTVLGHVLLRECTEGEIDQLRSICTPAEVQILLSSNRCDPSNKYTQQALKSRLRRLLFARPVHTPCVQCSHLPDPCLALATGKCLCCDLRGGQCSFTKDNKHVKDPVVLGDKVGRLEWLIVNLKNRGDVDRLNGEILRLKKRKRMSKASKSGRGEVTDDTGMNLVAKRESQEDEEESDDLDGGNPATRSSQKRETQDLPSETPYSPTPELGRNKTLEQLLEFKDDLEAYETCLAHPLLRDLTAEDIDILRSVCKVSDVELLLKEFPPNHPSINTQKLLRFKLRSLLHSRPTTPACAQCASLGLPCPTASSGRCLRCSLVGRVCSFAKHGKRERYELPQEPRGLEWLVVDAGNGGDLMRVRRYLAGAEGVGKQPSEGVRTEKVVGGKKKRIGDTKWPTAVFSEDEGNGNGDEEKMGRRKMSGMEQLRMFEEEKRVREDERMERFQREKEEEARGRGRVGKEMEEDGDGEEMMLLVTRPTDYNTYQGPSTSGRSPTYSSTPTTTPATTTNRTTSTTARQEILSDLRISFNALLSLTQHDLTSPLTHRINPGLQVLYDALAGEVEKALMMGDGGRLRGVVNDLVGIARMGEGSGGGRGTEEMGEVLKEELEFLG